MHVDLIPTRRKSGFAYLTSLTLHNNPSYHELDVHSLPCSLQVPSHAQRLLRDENNGVSTLVTRKNRMYGRYTLSTESTCALIIVRSRSLKTLLRGVLSVEVPAEAFLQRGQSMHAAQDGAKELTTQSSSATASGTSRPPSIEGGHGFASSFSMTFTIVCVRTSTDQEYSETVSYTIERPRWHLLSIAYPPRAQEERTPLHVPIAMGSAV